jgi:hypothetical protein
MRLSEFYANMRKEADDAAPDAIKPEGEEIDKVALATHIISEMDENEQAAFAQALGLTTEEEPSKEATETEEVQEDEEVVKQAEDIFTAGRIFARGMMAEAEGEG